MKYTPKLYAVLLLCVFFFIGCKKKKEEDLFSITNIEAGATINTAAMVKLTLSASANYEDIGIFISSTNTVPDWAEVSRVEGFVTGYGGSTSSASKVYRPCVANLQPNTTYYVKAYVQKDGKNYYSQVVTLKTTNETKDLMGGYSSQSWGGSVLVGTSIAPSFSYSETDVDKRTLYRVSGKLKFDGVEARDASDDFDFFSMYASGTTTVEVSYALRTNKYTIPCSTNISNAHQTQTYIDGVWYPASTIDLAYSKSGSGTIISSTSGSSSTKIYLINSGFSDSDFRSIKEIQVSGIATQVYSEYVNGDYVYYFYPPSSLSAGSGKTVYIYMPCSDYYISSFTKL